MSRTQAEIRAQKWSVFARNRHPSLNYRAEEVGKGKWSVIQYLGDHPVGIAMS